MPLTPNVEIFHLMPEQATEYGRPIQAFLRDTLHDFYVGGLGREMDLLADPTDSGPDGAVQRQIQRIIQSGDLREPGTAAYVLATDLEAGIPAHAGIVGLLKLSRMDAGTVEIEEMDVAPGRRGERIGPAMLDEALGTLAVSAGDTLVLDVLNRNLAGRRFWESMGFVWGGEQRQHRDVFPDGNDKHLRMVASESVVHLLARQRLRTESS